MGRRKPLQLALVVVAFLASLSDAGRPVPKLAKGAGGLEALSSLLGGTWRGSALWTKMARQQRKPDTPPRTRDASPLVPAHCPHVLIHMHPSVHGFFVPSAGGKGGAQARARCLCGALSRVAATRPLRCHAVAGQCDAPPPHTHTHAHAHTRTPHALPPYRAPAERRASLARHLCPGRGTSPCPTAVG